MITARLDPDRSGIDTAAALIRRGSCVAFPTETVYGLGADASSDTAVAGIYAAKARPSFNPLIVHVPDSAAAQAYVTWSDQAEALAQAFWPGPLALVLPLNPSAQISKLATAGLSTLAIRCPAHPVAEALLKAADRPIAAPSANPSGKISATQADHVLAGLSGVIDAVLDGGACDVGVESTIVGLGDTPRLLRPGGLAPAEIETVLGQPLAPPTEDITAPGQLTSHYAPSATLRLNAADAAPGELLLGFGAVAGDRSLSPTADLKEAASNLFAFLHWADAQGRPIAVAPIPDTGLGLAINDRLRRAAAPRP